MELSNEQRLGLNTALSEAHCLGASVDETEARVRLRLRVLTLPEQGPPPADCVIDVVLSNVGRIAASYRVQHWDDLQPVVHPLTPAGLAEAVRSFDGGSLHGWEFIDLPDSSWAQWGELLSFDVALRDSPAAHVLEMSQEEGMIEPRELDLRVWFDDIEIADATSGTAVTLDEFIAGGVRWWAAHDQGDPRTLVDDVAPPL